MSLLNCCTKVNRKKPLQPNYLHTELRRCLGIVDLTLLGVSGMLGAGLYVLTGAVAKDTSGPAVSLSYLSAAIAAFLSALCYAEFGARIPATGSSYIFTYVTMGELWGFLMGWNMVLEHGVGSASVAKAWSGYLDSVLGYPIKNYLSVHLPMGNGVPLGEYPDLVAAAVILLLCAFVATGAKSSTRFNMIFAFINIAVVVFIIATGFCLADIKNWTEVEGGFMPFGFSGVIAGASRCFFAFAGFDVIASSCEEARNPKRDIPIALAISLVLATVSYVGVSSVLTLMLPWNEIVPKSAIPDAFGRHDGWQWAQVIVTIGSLCTMTTSMFSGLFVMPRILYAISKDGLLCPLLSSINERTQVPLASVGFTALLCSIMALIFDLETLVQFMSIGTLTAYSFVAACVILLRYGAVGDALSVISKSSSHDSRSDGVETNRNYLMSGSADDSSDRDIEAKLQEEGDRSALKEQEKPVLKKQPAAETTTLMRDVVKTTSELNSDVNGDVSNDHVNTDENKTSVQSGTLKPKYRGTALDKLVGSCEPGTAVLISLVVCVGSSIAGMILVSETWDEMLHGAWWAILLFIVSFIISASSVFVIFAHQQHALETDKKSFKVPFVPFVPLLCICTNIFFMLKLQAMTWIRLLIWISVGFAIYFAYGFHHSLLNPNRDAQHWMDKVSLKLKKIFVEDRICRKRKSDERELLNESEYE